MGRMTIITATDKQPRLCRQVPRSSSIMRPLHFKMRRGRMCCGRHGTPCRPSAGSPSLPPSPMTCQLPPILAPPPRATASGALPLPLPPRRHAVSMSSMTPVSSTLCGPPVGPDIKKSLKLLRTHVPLKIKSYFECGCSPRCRPALCRRIGERNKCR